MTDSADWRERFPDTLRAFGEALYGPEWKWPLADDLCQVMGEPAPSVRNIRRLVSRWATGELAPRSPAVFDELAAVADIHAAFIADARAVLDRARPGDQPTTSRQPAAARSRAAPSVSDSSR